MAQKNFTDFDLEATLSGGDFIVGYREDGSEEIRFEIETLPVNAHKSNHEIGGSDVLSPSDIGAATEEHNHSGVYEPVRGSDDNYVTDAEKTVLGNTSGTNTGDQDLSGYVLTTSIDTLAELNNVIADATLIDTNDARLSDARTPTAHSHEGTSILSTGETGGTKFLREDGDGTSSWQPIAGGGGGSGWTLISEGSANSVATIIADNVFTDTYTEYNLVLIGAKIDTATAGVWLKLRASGADLTDFYSTAGMSSNVGGGAPSTFLAAPANLQRYWNIWGANGTGAGQYSHAEYKLWPRTGLNVRMMFQASAKGADNAFTNYIGAGEIIGVTSVDGFKITTSSEGGYTLDITKWRIFGR